MKLITKTLVSTSKIIKIPDFEDGTPWSFSEAAKRATIIEPSEEEIKQLIDYMKENKNSINK